MIIHVLKVNFIYLLNERLCYQLCGHWSMILPLLESDEHCLSQKRPFKGLFQRKLVLISPWVPISPRSLDCIGPDKGSQIRPKKQDCILLIEIAPFLGLKQISPIYSKEIIWTLLRFCRTQAKFSRTLTDRQRLFAAIKNVIGLIPQYDTSKIQFIKIRLL